MTAKSARRILHIAVPAPLFQGFDYLATPDTPAHLSPGCRIKVPFGRGEKIGFLLEEKNSSGIAREKLKTIRTVIDQDPVLDAELLGLGLWAANYYHYPLGEVLSAMLPAQLRRGAAAKTAAAIVWRLSNDGFHADPAAFKRAPRQGALLELLKQHAQGLSPESLDEHFDAWRQTIKSLLAKSLVETAETTETAGEIPQNSKRAHPASRPELNIEQQTAIDAIAGAPQGFKPWLLDGITGSGKTEVYLHLIERALARNEQTLVLVPEIGLTPQLLGRFRARLACDVYEIHSGLSDTQRLTTWIAAREGKAKVIVGTRSAVFTPLATPGLIIVDEEHDHSFKQQDSFRYHARDLAILRAQQRDIPVVLGSATPSLESLFNARSGRYGFLKLAQRAGDAELPRLSVVDARQTPAGQPLTRQLLEKMEEHLSQNRQVLIFLNRRGYAPVMMCFDCGWTASCKRCDAFMTWHKHDRRLRCHHCGAETALPPHCPDCATENLQALGSGTEQLESFLQDRFPAYELVRIDRDATRRKGSLEKSLDKAHSGEARILVGTQMLAKGHHFPGVTLVGILGIDHGLFSADFRGPEYMAQLITQVAGRAGRGTERGEVIIESRQPEHPLLQRLIREGHDAFAESALRERADAKLPPYSKLALIRAEAVSAETALKTLRELRDTLKAGDSVSVMGPAPAPMERRAGRYRAQLLLMSRDRPSLHAALREAGARLREMRQQRVRWSIDIDPVDML